MSAPPEFRYSFDKTVMLYDPKKKVTIQICESEDLDQRADRVHAFLTKAVKEGRVKITSHRDENIVAWRDKVPSIQLGLNRLPDALYAHGSKKVFRKDLPGTPDMYDIIDLNDARLALGFHEKEWAEWGEDAYRKSQEFVSPRLDVSGIYGEMGSVLGWANVPRVFYYLLTRKTQWWIESGAEVPIPGGGVIKFWDDRGDAQWKTWPEYRQLVIEQIEDLKSVCGECTEISMTLTGQEVHVMFQHNSTVADALIGMGPELGTDPSSQGFPFVYYDEIASFDEEDIVVRKVTDWNVPTTTIPEMTGECRARSDLHDAWAAFESTVKSLLDDQSWAADSAECSMDYKDPDATDFAAEVIRFLNDARGKVKALQDELKATRPGRDRRGGSVS